MPRGGEAIIGVTSGVCVPVYGLVGYPLNKSLSPVMHAAALRHCELPGEYRVFRVAPEGLEDFVSGVRRNRLAGLNVTIPHKVAVMAMVDQLTSLAARIGSVNTLYWAGDRLVGHNTDYGGFLASLPQDWPRERPVVILGAGGAARSVVCALGDQGVDAGVIINRTEELAQIVQRDCKDGWGTLGVGQHSEEAALDSVFAGCGLIVNTTPDPGAGWSDARIGRWVQTLLPDTVVYDLSYALASWGWLAQARDRGVITLDGKAMLLGQAAEAFECWTGCVAPLAVMREALLGEA